MPILLFSSGNLLVYSPQVSFYPYASNHGLRTPNEGMRRINQQVSRTNLENGHFYWSENRVKISLLFLTLETLDFESEHIFESHKHLQSTADMILALTCFYTDQIGPNWAKFGPNQAKSGQNSKF